MPAVVSSSNPSATVGTSTYITVDQLACWALFLWYQVYNSCQRSADKLLFFFVAVMLTLYGGFADHGLFHSISGFTQVGLILRLLDFKTHLNAY